MQQRNRYFCEKIGGFVKKSAKNYFPASPNTLVTLTHSYPLVTFRLKPFFSGI
jgi:hypothetical protein